MSSVSVHPGCGSQSDPHRPQSSSGDFSPSNTSVEMECPVGEVSRGSCVSGVDWRPNIFGKHTDFPSKGSSRVFKDHVFYGRRLDMGNTERKVFVDTKSVDDI